MKTLRSVLFISITFTLSLQAQIHQVPDDFTSIQEAITAASPGDTVAVAPGEYFENISFRGKSIMLTSHFYIDQDLSFIASTIINGSQPSHPDTGSVVRINQNENRNAILQGFTITGGSGTRNFNSNENLYFRAGGGILVDHASPTIRFNRIVDNASTNVSNSTGAGGGGLRVGNGKPVISHNIIKRNAGQYAGGMMLAFCEEGTVITNNIIADNYASGAFDGGGGVYIDWRPLTFVNNTIVNNESGARGGGIIVTGTKATLINNIIWGNTAGSWPQIYKRFNGTTDASFNNIEGGWAGNNNVDIDPLFGDSTYTLSQNSPCIDTGHEEATYNDVESSANAGMALAPSRGTIRNDLGAYGGPNAAFLYADTPLGASALKKSTFNIEIMNPADTFSRLFLTLTEKEKLQIQLFDAQGKLVEQVAHRSFAVGNHSLDIKTTHLTIGTYFVRVGTNRSLQTLPLLIMH